MAKANDTLNLIPIPEKITFKEGAFSFSEKTQIYLPKEFESDLKPYINEKVKADLGVSVQILTEKKKGAQIIFVIVKDGFTQDGAYTLDVSPKEIKVTSNSYAGLFYGFQTLRQLMPVNNGTAFEIPAVRIEDSPRFDWRGLMIDVSRHFQSKEFIMKQIDVIAAYKLNKFHWHLTDDQGWRVEIKKYALLTEKGAWRADRTGIAWWSRDAATADEPKTVGGFYTQDDIREVLEYARIRNVEVIPEIDVPGHSKALVASYPMLSCLDDQEFEVAVGGKAPDNALCPSKETTYEFLTDVVAEIAALFPTQYIHLGGDECNKSNWKKCPHCSKMMADEKLNDYEELQSYFMGRMNSIVNDHGKKMIGWDEILSGKGAKGATIMAWRRNRFTPELDAPRGGYPTIMTSYEDVYISQVQGPSILEPEGPRVVLPLSKVYNSEPMPSGLSMKEQELVLGTEMCLWAEFTPTESHAEYMLYPRTIAQSELAWSRPENKDWQRFQKNLPRHFLRLERNGVNYSKSMYSVYASYAIDELHGNVRVLMETETDGNEIRYTLNGKDPDLNSDLCTGMVTANIRSLLKAGLFNKDGKLLGKITEIRLR
ncbi:family 20 glycosylhydrolase [Portibacter lacus]|uniref:beta-N-acetylhexosaminidase n=1 Tax=Portibacter lacus TaxID=1099794 RepID=A0AA37WEC3_9BACT|nr:family 20 glycosylhydrolase [Portibacter lacus]GLR17082.1 hypothetical protein GCM10007940_16970 [Portibacter lacus]